MDNFFPKLTEADACNVLRGAGFDCSPEEICVDRREHRWAVTLPGDRMAWFAASEAGRTRLAVERRVLCLLGKRCTFQMPRLLYVSEAGFDVRRSVTGRCDPWGLFARCQASSPLAQNVGRSIGAILAQQHTGIRAADVTGWLGQQVDWPEPSAWIRDRLPGVIDDPELVRTMEHVIARYEAVSVDVQDRVLVHGDVGLHNVALDPRSNAVNGIFDYYSAAWADRHHDFRYLVFDHGREDMLDAALEVYEPTVGRSIDRARARLYNAACAISYLAYRHGIAPEQKWCGRTFAEDLRWVRDSLANLSAG